MTAAVTDAELIARSDANYFGTVRAWAEASPEGAVREHDGLLVAACGVPEETFNIAFVTHPLRAPEKPIRDAVSYLEARGMPFRVRIREGLDGNAEAALEAAGLEFSWTIPALVLDPLGVPAGWTQPLKIVEVTGSRTLEEHVGVVAAAFGMPDDALGRVISSRLTDSRAWRGYVGYVDGGPVAASQLLMTEGVAGIYFVATLEGVRRRGFGEAMTWHAIREAAAAGCDIVSLQASRLGQPVYEKMGFRSIGGYKTFVKPRPST